MKRWMICGLCAGAVALGGTVVVQSSRSIASDPVQPIPTVESPETSAFMKLKLNAAHRILTSLMTEDFERIRAAGDDLIRLSRGAEWNVVQDDPVYSHFSAEFQRQVTKLIAAAREKEIERTTFAWQNLTSTCVSCHQHVRDVVRVNVGDRPASTPRR